MRSIFRMLASFVFGIVLCQPQIAEAVSIDVLVDNADTLQFEVNWPDVYVAGETDLYLSDANGNSVIEDLDTRINVYADYGIPNGYALYVSAARFGDLDTYNDGNHGWYGPIDHIRIIQWAPSILYCQHASYEFIGPTDAPTGARFLYGDTPQDVPDHGSSLILLAFAVPALSYMKRKLRG